MACVPMVWCPHGMVPPWYGGLCPLGMVACVPMVWWLVSPWYGAWGTEAMESLSLLASRHATGSNSSAHVHTMSTPSHYMHLTLHAHHHTTCTLTVHTHTITMCTLTLHTHHHTTCTLKVHTPSHYMHPNTPHTPSHYMHPNTTCTHTHTHTHTLKLNKYTKQFYRYIIIEQNTHHILNVQQCSGGRNTTSTIYKTWYDINLVLKNTCSPVLQTTTQQQQQNENNVQKE